MTLYEGKPNDENSYRVMVLADMQRIFDQHGVEALASASICADLAEMEDRPWPEYRKGKPITPRQLASLLGPFGITPSTIRTKTGTPKGYNRSKLEDKFRRYVPYPPILSATPPQPRDSAEFGDFRSATKGVDVADRNGEKSSFSAGCGGVAAKTGGVPTQTLFSGDVDGDPDEREAIQAIDGEAAVCVHCNEFVGLNEPSIPCDGRVLHERCHDAFFGIERQPGEGLTS